MALAFMVAIFTAASAQPYDIPEIESRIHELINRQRTANGAEDLSIDHRLTILARAHTNDMVARDFYSHENPDGLTAPDRLDRAHPELVVLTVAENINLLEPVEPSRMSGRELAERMVQSWVRSAGHRRNLLAPEFTHTGIALSVHGERAIVTQIFTALLVEAISPNLSGHAGISAQIRFRYHGTQPRKRLTAFVEFPDRSARYFVSDRVYYTGSAPLVPRWKSDDEFTIMIPCELGRGVFTLSFGFGRELSGKGIAVECRCPATLPALFAPDARNRMLSSPHGGFRMGPRYRRYCFCSQGSPPARRARPRDSLGHRPLLLRPSRQRN
jgi:uncharacterized protein YkwD